MGIHCTALMCHAPIVVPAVGGDRGADCARTTAAMRRTACELVAARPDVLVLISPHTPRARHAWGLVDGARLVGDLGRFRAPQAAIDLPNATSAVRAIHAEAGAAGCPTTPLPSQSLDHGAVVPLWFLVEAGWSGPTVVVALPWVEADPAAFGAAIRAAAAASGQDWAVLASGDMSHRLVPGAPGGYHPRARDFDAAYVAAIDRGDLRGAHTIDDVLRELAGEDVVTSTAVASAASGWRSDGHEAFAYEAPFGVGYLEAILFREGGRHAPGPVDRA